MDVRARPNEKGLRLDAQVSLAQWLSRRKTDVPPQLHILKPDCLRLYESLSLWALNGTDSGDVARRRCPFTPDTGENADLRLRSIYRWRCGY